MRLSSILNYSSIILSLVPKVHSSDCSCKQVTSWEDLKALISEANNAHLAAQESQEVAAASSPPLQQTILLCPFRIKKEVDASTNHWAEFLNIKAPMNLVCKKEQASDACWVEVFGEKCSFNENCGRAMIKVSSGELVL